MILAQRRDEGAADGGGSGPPKEDTPDEVGYRDLSILSASGPLSSSARVAILAALLAFRRTTFTELMLAVSVPKSSLNLSLTILKSNGFVVVKKGFLGMRGPRTIVEITPAGEIAIKDHLIRMRSIASRLLQGKSEGAK